MKTLVTILLITIATTAHAEPNWELGRGWNKNMLKRLTKDCVSAKLPDVQTEYAAQMLEESCFQEVLAGTWTKKSRKKYEEDKRKLLIEKSK